MKKQFLSLAAVATLAVATVACSNNSNETANNDTAAATTVTTETSTASSTGNYAAMADSVEQNSAQGYYLNPKTGKPYGKLTVDRSNGRITTEAGEPVWRYVDNRNWWVYGYNTDNSNWGQSGEAKMQGDKLVYKGDNDQWTDYNTRWSKEDEDMIKKSKVSDDGNKVKMETEDGEKVKIKTDEEGNTKIKTEDGKIKVDSNGKVIKKG